MMKFAALALAVSSAAAFAPASHEKSSTSLMADFSGEVGVTKPLGFFDPLNLLEDASQERFDRLRTVEIKHGRLCMLAVVGYLTTIAGYRLPGLEDVPAGIQAFPSLPSEVKFQMLMTFGILEMINRDRFGKSEFIGDWRNGALDFGWDKFDEPKKLRKRNIELNQGRAAMMGITGLITHELLGESILPGGLLP